MAEQKKYIDLPGLLYYNQGLNTNVLQDIRDQITGLGDADNEFISQLGNINTSIVGINNSLKTKLDNTTLYAASPSTGGPATKALSIIDYNSSDSNVIDCKISKTPIEKTTGVLGLYLEDKNTVKFNLTDTLDFKNGSITAKTLIGNLTGDVTGTADNAKNLKMNFAGQDNAARNIWINTYANASDTTGNLSVSSTSKFAFNPSTNKLTIGSGSLTGEEYSGKSKTAGTADYATKIGTVDSNYTKSSLDKEFEKYQPLLPKLDNQQNKVLKVNSSGKLEWMTDELGPNNIYSAGEGLDKSTDGTDSGEFKVNFGGDGSATTVSRSDHSHSNYLRNNADDTFTGKLTVEGSISTTKDVTIGGNLTVNGETTTLNVTNLNVEDKLISLGYTPSPSITTGSNGGIQVITKKDASIFKGPSIKWVSSGKNSTSGWKISSDDSAAPSNLIVAGDIYVNTDKKVWSLDNLPNPVTGIKGSNESSYRTGQVNITCDNIGAVGTTGNQSISGVKKFKDIVVIPGTAGDKHIRTRGICGLESDDAGETLGPLYLQYTNDSDTVYFGKAAGGNISSNGTQYSGNAATATDATNLRDSTGSVNAATVRGKIDNTYKFNLGTTSIALNRKSEIQSLTGINIDGQAAYLKTSDLSSNDASSVTNSYRIVPFAVDGSTTSFGYDSALKYNPHQNTLKVSKFGTTNLAESSINALNDINNTFSIHPCAGTHGIGLDIVANMSWSRDKYAFQYGMDVDSTYGDLYIRKSNAAGVWSDWKKVWHTGSLPAPGTNNNGKVLKANADGTVSWQTDVDTNTWRGITDAYNGSASDTSLSQKGAKALYDDLYGELNNGYAASAGNANTLDNLDSSAFMQKTEDEEITGTKTFTKSIYLTNHSYINYDSTEEAIVFNFV